jgi:tetratricopeptide (TPR) repeat protein
MQPNPETSTVNPMNWLKTLLLFCALCIAPWAAAGEDMIKPIQDEWAEIKYRQADKQQAAGYKALAQKAHRLSEANPNAAEALIWESIVLSSEAGASGGLGALGLIKEARRLLEESIKLDEQALQGSAYTSLGALYAKVPRWPIAFGDKKKAEELFKKGLAINPKGIDPHFFYGEFLLDEGRSAEARKHLEAALQAPARPGRELADRGRRQEVQAAMSRLKDTP